MNSIHTHPLGVFPFFLRALSPLQLCALFYILHRLYVYFLGRHFQDLACRYFCLFSILLARTPTRYTRPHLSHNGSTGPQDRAMSLRRAAAAGTQEILDSDCHVTSADLGPRVNLIQLHFETERYGVFPSFTIGLDFKLVSRLG